MVPIIIEINRKLPLHLIFGSSERKHLCIKIDIVIISTKTTNNRKLLMYRNASPVILPVLRPRLAGSVSKKINRKMSYRAHIIPNISIIFFFDFG